VAAFGPALEQGAIGGIEIVPAKLQQRIGPRRPETAHQPGPGQAPGEAEQEGRYFLHPLPQFVQAVQGLVGNDVPDVGGPQKTDLLRPGQPCRFVDEPLVLQLHAGVAVDVIDAGENAQVGHLQQLPVQMVGGYPTR